MREIIERDLYMEYTDVRVRHLNDLAKVFTVRDCHGMVRAMEFDGVEVKVKYYDGDVRERSMTMTQFLITKYEVI